MVAIHDRMNADARLLAGREHFFSLALFVGGSAFDLLEPGVAGELESIQNAESRRKHAEQYRLVDRQPFGAFQQCGQTKPC